MVLEGLEEASNLDKPPRNVNNLNKDIQQKNSAERMVSTGVVLLSKQLREMCETSLQSLAQLFEKLSQPLTSEYSVFVINMRLRKRRTGEVATDFNEAVEVSLQPDLVEIKSAMSTCVHKLVNASRGFPRPEQSMSQMFGGKNNHLVSGMIGSTRHSKMNESSVSLQDEIVYDVTTRIHNAAKHYFEAPMKLLKGFESLESFLSGRCVIFLDLLSLVMPFWLGLYV